MGAVRRRAATLHLVGLSLGLAATTPAAQLLPPPRDGDIRVLYWELRDETEVWLTLEPRSPGGEKLPISLTLRVGFPGKRPATALTQAEVRAYVNLLWAPQPRLTVVMDGRAAARSISGNALRLDFALDDSQRAAVARFAERALSPDPALSPPHATSPLTSITRVSNAKPSAP